MFKLTVQPYGLMGVLLEDAATPAVNQVTSLATVLLRALRHRCGVVAGVVATEGFGLDMLAPTARQPATTVADLIIMLAIAKPRP